MTTFAASGSAFVPQEGMKIVVNLPGEVMRCPVVKGINANAAVVEIDSAPMSKVHMFRFGDKVGVRRRTVDGRDIWEALSDREFVANQSRLIPTPPEVAKPPEPEPKPAKKTGGKRAARTR